MRRAAADTERDRRSASASREAEDAAGAGSTARSRPVAAVQRAIGNRGVQALRERGDLRVGPADSPAEREAERVADAVMDAPEPARGRSEAGSGNRGETDRDGGEDCCAACATESVGVQRASEAAAVGAAPEASDAAGPVPGDAAASVRAVQGGGRPPSSDARSFFEPRFGREFGDVRVHTGSRADEAARSVNARAGTYGRDVAFRRGAYRPGTESGRRLLAHELAHVVQQSEGTERVQRYLKLSGKLQKNDNSLGWKHPARSDIRVSDDGRMVVEDNGWGEDANKRAWTTKAELSESNAKLQAAGSNTKLVEASGTVSGKPPDNPYDGKTRTLTEIEPEKASGSGRFTLKSDCGAACKQVMGSAGEKDVGVYQKGQTEAYTDAETYTGADRSPGGTTNTPEEFFEDVLRDAFGSHLSRSELYKRYDGLSDEEQKRFDRKYGLNQYAEPEVGQGQTISTGYDTPGFGTHSGKKTWNFHYAATVLRSGDDHVTLESADGWAPGGWIFHMYGLELPYQSFHQEHDDTMTHGNRNQTMVVQPAERLEGKTDAPGVHLVRVPRKWKSTRIGKLSKGTKVKTIRKGDNWRKVEVLDGRFQGRIGWISNTFLEQ